MPEVTMEGKRVIYEPCPKHAAQFERGLIVLSCKKCTLALANPEPFCAHCGDVKFLHTSTGLGDCTSRWGMSIPEGNKE